MITKSDKKRIYIYAICIFFFFLAGFFQKIDSQMEEFYHALFALFAHTILISLVVTWGVSLIHRMVRKDLLAFFITIASLILFFLVVRMIKYGLTEEIDTLSRYLWYSYYVPQCFIPPTLLLISLSIENKNGKVFSKIWYFIYLIPIILVTLIYTNDIHELAFKLYFDNNSFSYKHNIIFYIALYWEIIITFISLVVMFLKCSVSACKRKTWIPIGTFFICVIISTICFISKNSAFKIPELLCFTCIVVIESCICIGLVPSNVEYENYFYNSAYSALITNDSLDEIYYKKNAPHIGKNLLKKAVLTPIMLDKNTRLVSKKIHGGYAFRKEDLSLINKINESLREANERLLEENYLIEAENEIKEQRAKIKQQNDIYAKMDKYTNNELKQLEELLDNTKYDNDDFKNNMYYACVLASYIKRRNNLFMLAEQNNLLDVNELFISLKESLDYLLLLNIECSLNFNIKGKANGKALGMLYDFFKECAINSNKSCQALIIHLYKQNDKITMLIESDDIKSIPLSLKEKFPNAIIKMDDDVTYYSLSIGGIL